jgi:cyclic pyranopterin phosphate synthase
MPENPEFMSSKEWISSDEIIRIAHAFYKHGIEEIRLTGGEPTLRKDVRDIITKLSDIPFRKIGMTTNGYFLSQLLPFLKETRCQHINISMDSLQEEKFNRITRSKAYKKTRKAIEDALSLNFSVKINVVVMKGINEDEILDFVNFSAQHCVNVRFLELMRIGQAASLQEDHFFSADATKQVISERENLISVDREADSTAFEFTTSGGARIGFIAPVTHSFCGSCSRWRLSADGFLRACLMSTKKVSLRGLSEEALHKIFLETLRMKPLSGHDEVLQNMHAIGG